MSDEKNNEGYPEDLQPVPKRKHPAWMYEAMALARMGVDDWSIGCKVFGSGKQFMDNLRKYPGLKDAIDIARADFQIDNAIWMNNFIKDPDVPATAKAKQVRDNLKTQKAFAPAVQAVKVVSGDKKTIIEFGEMSPEEIAYLEAKNRSEEVESEEFDSEE